MPTMGTSIAVPRILLFNLMWLSLRSLRLWGECKAFLSAFPNQKSQYSIIPVLQNSMRFLLYTSSYARNSSHVTVQKDCSKGCHHPAP